MEKIIFDKVQGLKFPEGQDARAYSEGIMELFYNALLKHWSLCLDEDKRCILTNDISVENYEDYVAAYRKMDEVDLGIPWSILPIIEKSVLGNDYEKELKNAGYKDNLADIKEIIERIKFLITYGQEISKENQKYYKTAFQYCKEMVQWWYGEKMTGDISEFARWDLIVPVIQEIVDVAQKKIEISVPYHNCKYVKNSLISYMKQGSMMDAYAKKIWINRFDERTTFNFGQAEHLKVKNNIERLLAHYKEYVFSFLDLADIKNANEELNIFMQEMVLNSSRKVWMIDIKE